MSPCMPRGKEKSLSPLQLNFLSLYRSNLCNKARACRKAGISRQTLYLWIRHDPNFLGRMRENEWEDLEEAEQLLRAHALSGDNTSALIFFLRHKHPDYRDTPLKRAAPRHEDCQLDDRTTKWLESWNAVLAKQFADNHYPTLGVCTNT